MAGKLAVFWSAVAICTWTAAAVSRVTLPEECRASKPPPSASDVTDVEEVTMDVAIRCYYPHNNSLIRKDPGSNAISLVSMPFFETGHIKRPKLPKPTPVDKFLKLQKLRIAPNTSFKL